MVPSVQRLKRAVSSKKEFVKFCETKEWPEDEDKAFFNEDLLPTPPRTCSKSTLTLLDADLDTHQRTWTALHFGAYYLTTTFSPGSYNLGATLVSIGLQWWHGIIAAIIGSAILSVIVILNSRGATKYHIGYPVYVRASGGIIGSRLFVIVRASVAIIYFATQTYYGGRLLSVAFHAIFGSGWENIPNALPESAGITSRDLLAFFIFWIIQFPVMFVHPVFLRHLFIVKAIFTSASLVGVLAWAATMNGGSLGNFDFDGESLHGSSLVWPMIQAINSVLAALCPILINQPDVARYSKSFKHAAWSQAVGILGGKVLVMFLSCATSSASSAFLGEAYWNVWDLYDAILTQYWSPAARAGIFFACCGMCLAVIGSNAGTNSLPVGADIGGLFPRWVNIVRGQVFCAFLAPLLVPWKIIADAQSFLTFLGSYTVFLMPICGIMVVDYWLIRKGNFHVPSLFTREPDSPYTYFHGWNLRAVVAWVSGVAFVVHGIAGNLDPDSVSSASKNMYKLGFILSFLMSGLMYYVLSLIWPVPIYPPYALERGARNDFEYMIATEGYLDGESPDTIQGILGGVMSADEQEVDAPAYSKELHAEVHNV